MTVSDVGSSFDDNFANHSIGSDSACTAQSQEQRGEPSVGNPEDMEGLVNHNLCSTVSSMQSSVADGFAFSIEQLTCPVVIEIFSGSARLTASLKEVGIRDAFGVDHKLDKAVATAKRLGLTAEKDQSILLQWLESPLVVGVFLAPPCGTCSLARNIKLRDSTGKIMHGPKPLRSAEWPEGLPRLGPQDRARVSAANKLYDFLARLVDLAHDKGLLVVETQDHPFSGLQDLGRKSRRPCNIRRIKLALTVERDLNGLLAWNHPAFSSISLCPGESDVHKHKPWGLVHSESGIHFSTSEETAYPKGLANTIARVFASILSAHGWKPPLEQMQEQQDVSLRSMRAVATAQPKASKMPPIVREHKKSGYHRAFQRPRSGTCGMHATAETKVAHTTILSSGCG